MLPYIQEPRRQCRGITTTPLTVISVLLAFIAFFSCVANGQRPQKAVRAEPRRPANGPDLETTFDVIETTLHEVNSVMTRQYNVQGGTQFWVSQTVTYMDLSHEQCRFKLSKVYDQFNSDGLKFELS